MKYRVHVLNGKYWDNCGGRAYSTKEGAIMRAKQLMKSQNLKPKSKRKRYAVIEH